MIKFTRTQNTIIAYLVIIGLASFIVSGVYTILEMPKEDRQGMMAVEVSMKDDYVLRNEIKEDVDKFIIPSCLIGQKTQSPK